MLAAGLAAGALAPQSLPTVDPLLGSTAQATAVATFALELVAFGLCAYVALVLLALLLVQARLAPAGLRDVVDRWTSGGLAGGLRRAVGASVLTIGLVTPTAAHASGPVPPVMAPAEEPPATTTTLGRPPVMAPAEEVAPPPTTTSPERPVLEAAGEPPAPPPTTSPGRPPVMAPADEAEQAAQRPPPTPPSPPPAPASTVVVQPGDSFWSIAEQLVELRTRRAPSDPEVIGPWLDLIAENRDVLPDPDDPDLLLPGTVLDLPR
jgi:hypothetical protein